MTSVEIPFSIAAALPSLAVVDVTNEVGRAVAASPHGDGIAYVSSHTWDRATDEVEAGLRHALRVREALAVSG